jgi:hypothetical protein
VSGDISANTNLYLGGDASFNNDVFVSGDISGNSKLYLGGDASLKSKLIVSGDISANTHLYLGGDASFNADVFVSGDISGNSKLYLDDDALLKSKLIVSGDISANTNLYLGGDASFNNDVFVSGDISGNSKLYLDDDALLKSKLIVSGDISANTHLYLGGDASLNKDLFVSGVTKLGVVNNTEVPLYVDGSGAMRIPVGSNSDRPAEVETGQIRFNTTDDTFEGYDGSNWGSLGGVSNADKSSRVYIDDSDSIVFETNSKIRETIDTSGNVSFDVSNSEGYGEINMYQSGTATTMEVKDSSNNNTIKIQNQEDVFKLIYDQSGLDSSSRIEMQDNEIRLNPNHPESALTSNYNGVMIGNDSALKDTLYDKTWDQIGYIGKGGGTKYGNTVSVSQDGKKMAVGEHETTSTTSRVYIYDIYERGMRLIETITIDSGHVTSIDINQDGSKVVVGIYDASDGSPINTGGIELYELNSNTSQYEQVGSIRHGTTEDAYLGHTTSINNDGSIFAAGQYRRNVDTTGTSTSTIEGGVLVLQRSGDNINIIADISLNGHSDTTQFKEMGRSIELNGAGDRIIIGGTQDDSVSGAGVHRVYIYQKQENEIWNKVFDISNSTSIGMNFGLSVAMSNDGKVIAVATQERNDVSEDGVVFIYDISGSGIGIDSNLTYTQRGSNITLSGIDNMDIFGASMSLNADGSVIAIASGSLDNFNGHAYIYKYLNSDWKLVKDIAGSAVENLGGIHNYDIDNMRLISDEDGICLDATGNLVAIGAPNLYSADDTDALGNGSAYLYRNQVYTLGVNEKLRVKGDIVVDDGVIDVSGYLSVSGNATINDAFVGTWTGNDNYAVFCNQALNANKDDYAIRQGTDGNTIINSKAGQNLEFRINNDNKMIIASDGNVGIGTTNPSAKLDVAGSANITGDLNIQDGNLTIEHSSNTGDFDPYILLNSNQNNNNHGGISSLFLTEQFFGSDKIQGAYMEYNGDGVSSNFFVIGTQNATNSGSNVLRVEALRINRESGNIISASAPTDDTHLTNKLYVDTADATLQTNIDGKVSKTGNETIGGIKTFTSGIVANGGISGGELEIIGDDLVLLGADQTFIEASVGDLRIQTTAGDGLTKSVKIGMEDAEIASFKSGDIQLKSDTTITGDLTVGGTNPIILRSDVHIGDNSILNTDETATPSGQLRMFLNGNIKRQLGTDDAIKSVFNSKEHHIYRDADTDYVNVASSGLIRTTHRITFGYTDELYVPYPPSSDKAPTDHAMKFEVAGRGSSILNEVLRLQSDRAVVSGNATIKDAFVGTWVGNDNYAVFCNQALQANNNDYAIRQGNTGNTIINSKSGQSLDFRIGNANKMTIESDGNVGITNDLSVDGILTYDKARCGTTGEVFEDNIRNSTALATGTWHRIMTAGDNVGGTLIIALTQTERHCYYEVKFSNCYWEESSLRVVNHHAFVTTINMGVLKIRLQSATGGYPGTAFDIYTNNTIGVNELTINLKNAYTQDDYTLIDFTPNPTDLNNGVSIKTLELDFNETLFGGVRADRYGTTISDFRFSRAGLLTASSANITGDLSVDGVLHLNSDGLKDEMFMDWNYYGNRLFEFYSYDNGVTIKSQTNGKNMNWVDQNDNKIFTILNTGEGTANAVFSYYPFIFPNTLSLPATGQVADDNFYSGIHFQSHLNSYATYAWNTVNQATVARIWHQPKRYDEVGSGDAGIHGLLNFSCARSTFLSRTPSMSITSTGNVGIGTDNPQQKLEIHGNILLGKNDANSFIHGGGNTAFSSDATLMFVSDSNDTEGASGSDSDIIFGSGSATDMNSNRAFSYGEAYPNVAPRNQHMRIKGSNGNVGIGTTNPASKLHIHEDTGQVPTASKGSLTITHGNSGGESSIVFPSKVNPNSDYGYISYRDDLSNDAGENGVLTIGVENDKSSLTIREYIVFKIGSITGMQMYGLSSTAVIVEIEGTCQAKSFNATSDIRVKTNIETIEPNEALEQINKLEPKTYKFYDSEETHYGLVAQDAEQIIPEAVDSGGTKMIPSIGETCKLINDGKTIVLDTKTTTDMVATKLEFDDISGNKQSVEIETFEGEKYIHLKSSIEEHAIKTSDGLTIYVHGHEVNDFRSINYNTIVAANVAATKALTRELNETRTELNETRTELNETRTELNETRTELNELKKLVEQLLNK